MTHNDYADYMIYINEIFLLDNIMSILNIY